MKTKKGLKTPKYLYAFPLIKCAMKPAKPKLAAPKSVCDLAALISTSAQFQTVNSVLILDILMAASKHFTLVRADADSTRAKKTCPHCGKKV